MAELADAYGSGPYGGNPMEVQVLSPAPFEIERPASAGLFASGAHALLSTSGMAEGKGFQLTSGFECSEIHRRLGDGCETNLKFTLARNGEMT